MRWRQVPDAEHTLAGHVVDIGTSVATFWWRIVYNQPAPKYTWTTTTTDNSTYTITVTTDTPVQLLLAGCGCLGERCVALTRSLSPSFIGQAAIARMYHAHNPWARDFRLVTNDDPIVVNPILWIEEPIANSVRL